MKNGNLIVLAGPAGCGKSSWAEALPDIPKVSSDAIREELFGDENAQLDPSLVFSTAYERAKALLDEGRSVIFDATNCRKIYRKNLLYEVGAHAGKKICVVYGGSLETCLKQNVQRERTVPERVVKGMYFGLRKDPPTTEEGFDMIFKLDPDSATIVSLIEKSRE